MERMRRFVKVEMFWRSHQRLHWRERMLRRPTWISVILFLPSHSSSSDVRVSRFSIVYSFVSYE